MMKQNGARGVTLLIASPPIFYPCRYGIDMKTSEQLLAAVKKGDLEEIRSFVGADELHYLSLKGLREVVEEEGKSTDFCFACFDGKYAL
jgi:amidophosphoribosyltransferase